MMVQEALVLPEENSFVVTGGADVEEEEWVSCWHCGGVEEPWRSVKTLQFSEGGWRIIDPSEGRRF